MEGFWGDPMYCLPPIIISSYHYLSSYFFFEVSSYLSYLVRLIDQSRSKKNIVEKNKFIRIM